jgi:hypothetical protein
LENKSILKIIPYRVKSNFSDSNFDNIRNGKNMSNTINFIGESSTNVITQLTANLHLNSNNNLNLNINKFNNAFSSSNYVNFDNFNSNQESSFVAKPTSGSAIIYKKNQDLNFSTKITDSNSSLREIIGAYSINKKVFKILIILKLL